MKTLIEAVTTSISAGQSTTMVKSSVDVTGIKSTDQKKEIDTLKAVNALTAGVSYRIHHCGHDTNPPTPCWIEVIS